MRRFEAEFALQLLNKTQIANRDRFDHLTSLTIRSRVSKCVPTGAVLAEIRQPH